MILARVCQFLVLGVIVAESIFLSLAGGGVGVILAVVVSQAKGLARGAEGVMMSIRPT